MTAPGVLLVIFSLEIVMLFAIGPGEQLMNIYRIHSLDACYLMHFSNYVPLPLVPYPTPYPSLCTLLTSYTLPAGIPWMMVAELFLQEARPVAVTIGTAVNWFANFTVALTFPYILVRGGRGGGQH